MKSNAQILDEFGHLVTKEVFDKQYEFILNKVEDLAQTEGYRNLFTGMNSLQKKEMEFYTSEILKASLFDFLRVFEENNTFKIVYENDGQKVDLNQITDMIKSEPIIENGWIERFSETIKKSNDIQAMTSAKML